jgi:hypothetical protein
MPYVTPRNMLIIVRTAVPRNIFDWIGGDKSISRCLQWDNSIDQFLLSESALPLLGANDYYARRAFHVSYSLAPEQR